MTVRVRVSRSRGRVPGGKVRSVCARARVLVLGSAPGVRGGGVVTGLVARMAMRVGLELEEMRVWATSSVNVRSGSGGVVRLPHVYEFMRKAGRESVVAPREWSGAWAENQGLCGWARRGVGGKVWWRCRWVVIMVWRSGV